MFTKVLDLQYFQLFQEPLGTLPPLSIPYHQNKWKRKLRYDLSSLKYNKYKEAAENIKNKNEDKYSENNRKVKNTNLL